jgi:hypothetical protein
MIQTRVSKHTSQLGMDFSTFRLVLLVIAAAAVLLSRAGCQIQKLLLKIRFKHWNNDCSSNPFLHSLRGLKLSNIPFFADGLPLQPSYTNEVKV